MGWSFLLEIGFLNGRSASSGAPQPGAGGGA